MDANDFVKSLGTLGSRYVNEYTRNVERYVQFVSGMCQQPPVDTTTGKAVQDRYVEFLRVEGPKVSKAVVDAGLNYYTALLNTGIETANKFFEQVTQPKPTEPSAQAKRQAPVLLFRGGYGDWPTNAFAVSNNRDSAIEVRFEVTDIVSDDGATRFPPTARFVPEACQLAPNAEQIVQCSVQLTEQFEAGQQYRAQIRVVGFPEMTMRISLQVDDVIDSPAPPPAKPGKKRKK